MPEGKQNTQSSESKADYATDTIPEEARPIKLSSKTLVHISSGLYRSTANALKELVSNSFDADADFIRINTNYPEFDVLTCSDNGDGIKISDFRRLMEGGIGHSLKRIGEEVTPQLTKKRRPIIGRIGIGMLAIAQICYEFTVVSHHKESGTAFRAVLNLNPNRLIEVSTGKNEKEYQVGFYTWDEIDYDATQAGFFISTNDLIPTYTVRYREDVRRDEFREIPKNFKGFLKVTEKHKSITSLGDYWRLFWELALASPIPYMEGGPFSQSLTSSAVKKDSRAEAKQVLSIIQELRTELKRYNFKVILDGISLYKPVLIPIPSDDVQNKVKENRYKTKDESEIEIEPRLTPVRYNDKIIGQPLKVRGYIYTQNRAIYPSELRGLLIRIKNVGIDGYDRSCLNYESIQGFRQDWLSGEIYIDEGLEEALNVDRNSFNEIHPHYLELQKYLHHALKDVFSEARRASEAKHKLKEKTRAKNVDKEFIKVIERVLKVKYRIQRVEGHNFSEKPLEVNPKEHVIVLRDEHPLWPRRKSDRAVAEKVLMAFRLAQAHEKSSDDVDEKFLAILQEVL